MMGHRLCSPMHVAFCKVPTMFIDSVGGFLFWCISILCIVDLSQIKIVFLSQLFVLGRFGKFSEVWNY